MKKLGMATMVAGVLLSRAAIAGPQLQWVWSCNGQTYTANGCQTVIFLHGKADCSTAMGDCNSYDATTGPVGYFTNSYNNQDMLNESTTKYFGSTSSYQYFEAFVIGVDMRNQGFWGSANDAGACIQDLYQGSNNSGCNPSHYQRTSFYVVTHSAGGNIIDRLLSTGWYSVNSHVKGVIAIAGSLAGSRAASALYGIDGYSNFCTTLVRWLAGWYFKDAAASSLTRSSVIGEANKGYAGRSPIWINKITTTGGGGSANNNNSVAVNEHDNDGNMGALVGCLGYNSSDDTDGLIYWSDSDPTNNTGGNGCPGDHSCHYYSQFSGSYWHWIESWANHSHSRDDAYRTLGDWQTPSGCYFRTPGTCVGQYGVY